MSWTKNDRLRCDECGKIMAFEKAYYTWSPYGNSTDLEPREDEHAHKECYENLPENMKELINRTSYNKPYLYEPTDKSNLF